MGMILFQEDWEKNPHVVVHTQTTNKSFLEYSELLRTMGVKNYLYPLQLHDRRLTDVDPFDPDLTMEQVLMIAAECYNNFFYFMREVARDPAGRPERPIKFRANRSNMAVYWMYWNHVTTITIQPRQTGKSFGIDNLDNYLLNVRGKRMEINLLTKNDVLRTRNLERIKNLEGMLPSYLKVRTRWDLGNGERLTVKALANSYQGHLPSPSPKLAENVGRGMTSANFRVDEFAFFINIGISLPAALAAAGAAQEIAAELDEPWGNVFSTTAGKLNDPDGAYAYAFLMEAMEMSEHLYDCKNIKELEKVIRQTSPSGKLRVNCTWNAYQLGYDAAWLKGRIENAAAEGEAAERDFLNKWTTGGVSSPFTQDQLDMIQNSEYKDFYTDISAKHSFLTRWFMKREQIPSAMMNDHVLSLDTSDAIGNDDIGLVLRNVRTGGISAAGNYNEINLMDFAEFIFFNFLLPYPKTTLIIEARSSGRMMIDALIKLMLAHDIDPFKRIYNTLVQDMDSKPEVQKLLLTHHSHREPEVYERNKRAFGFATSSGGLTSRSDLYGVTMANAVKQTGTMIHDGMLIKQMLSLRVKDGRIDHHGSGHDDMVIAYNMSYWLIYQGRNLQYYGMDTRNILSENASVLKTNDPEAKYKKAVQDKVKKEIEEISNIIKNERDDILVSRYEFKLRHLVSQLDSEARNNLSIEGLINDLKEQRRIKRHVSSNQNYHRTMGEMSSGSMRAMPTYGIGTPGMPGMRNSPYGVTGYGMR